MNKQELIFKLQPKRIRVFTVDEGVELSAILVNKSDETVEATLTVEFPNYFTYTTRGGRIRQTGEFVGSFEIEPNRQKPVRFSNITHTKSERVQLTIDVTATIGDATYSETINASLYQ